jgi:hypothetical protein
MGDLAETSAVCVDGVERFIAAGGGGVEFCAAQRGAPSRAGLLLNCSSSFVGGFQNG